MTPNEIRSSFRHDADNSQTAYLPCVTIYVLAEIAAQLAELNETLKSKQLVAHAHLHTSGPSDPYDGLA